MAQKRPEFKGVDSNGNEYGLSAWEQKFRNDEIRRKAFKWHGKRCAKCGFESSRRADLVVHHRHYRTFGKENSEDVVVLCPSCHEDLHDRHKAGKLTADDVPFVDPAWAWLKEGQHVPD